MRLRLVTLLLLSAVPTIALAQDSVTLTPKEKTAILCAERINQVHDGLEGATVQATGAKLERMKADMVALERLSKLNEANLPAYPSALPALYAVLRAQAALLEADTVTTEASAKWNKGDAGPMVRLVRQCEAGLGAKVLGPTFGSWYPLVARSSSGCIVSGPWRLSEPDSTGRPWGVGSPP